MSDQRSIASEYIERLLVGTLEACARAGAKALESLAGDAKKALRDEANKVEMLEKGVEAWRKLRLGDDDLPDSLKNN